MLCKEIIAIYYENHTKQHKNLLCEIYHVALVGTNHLLFLDVAGQHRKWYLQQPRNIFTKILYKNHKGMHRHTHLSVLSHVFIATIV
jgi:hypothetical protein